MQVGNNVWHNIRSRCRLHSLPMAASPHFSNYLQQTGDQWFYMTAFAICATEL